MQRTKHGRDGASPLISVLDGPESVGMRYLSSRWTIFYKYLFPAMWMALGGFVVLIMFVNPDG
jgi:hypothetical protein